MALPRWTDTQILDQLITGNRWYGQTITYGFPTTTASLTGEAEKAGFQELNSVQQNYATLALTLWDDLIAPDFSRTNLYADVEFALSDTGVSYALAYYPRSGTVWFNKNESGLTSPVIGDHGFMSYIHEIGHALGLDHMGDYDGEGDWSPSSYQDSSVYTVMSYFGPDWQKGSGDVAWADWTGADGKLYSPQTPALYDIQAIQKIYGLETQTRVSNTVYGFNSNVTGIEKDIFDFSLNKSPIITIFDSDGVDTIDLSGWSTPSEIDLTPGSYSSANSMTNNIAIAFSATIENVVGGRGNDKLTGNASNNSLEGLGGNDTINGGEGVDVVKFTGVLKDYQINYDKTSRSFTVADTIFNRDGQDLVSFVEYFQFSDVTLATTNFLERDPVNGSDGNDFWVAKIGDQQFNGLTGFDTLFLSGNRLDYQVNKIDGKIFIVDNISGRDGNDVAISVEELKFKDGELIFDVPETTNNTLVYRLYKAAFARAPDESGFRFWLEASKNNLSIDQIAGNFRASTEFIQKYGSNLTNAAYVDQLYQNVLGRAGEQAGQNFWLEQLSSGKVTDNQLLVYFADSPENKINTAQNVDNGYWLV